MAKSAAGDHIHAMPHIHSVAVFCGSRSGNDPAYRTAAQALGQGLAEAAIRLVYGGGRIGLINSGGESKGESDLAEAVRTAIINKRAGGMVLISGRKAFQRPMKDGVSLLNAIQDVYLSDEVTIA